MNLSPAPNGYLCKDDPGEPGYGSPRWSVNDVEARIISELCRGLRVLEIGTGLGISTKEIAKRAKYVYTVDIDPWVKENVSPTLPGNAFFCEDISELKIVNFDAVFVDGEHSYEQVKKDIQDARKLVKQDGLFIFHDVMMGSVKQAIIDSGLEAVLVVTVAGIAIAWNK